jgi:hypothetical protein
MTDNDTRVAQAGTSADMQAQADSLKKSWQGSMSDDDPMEFLAAGLLVLQTLPSDVRARWRGELFRVIEQRGGLTSDGKRVDKTIVGEVFSEVVERATRNFVNELTERARADNVSEDEIEGLEVEVSNTLRRMLDDIAEKL